MDSDEDDEEPQNEPETSSTSQTTVPVLPLHQRRAASSQGPAATDNSLDEDSEYSDGYSAQSWASQKTLYYPDLHVLTEDEHWTMTRCSFYCPDSEIGCVSKFPVRNHELGGLGLKRQPVVCLSNRICYWCGTATMSPHRVGHRGRRPPQTSATYRGISTGTGEIIMVGGGWVQHESVGHAMRSAFSCCAVFASYPFMALSCLQKKNVDQFSSS